MRMPTFVENIDRNKPAMTKPNSLFPDLFGDVQHSPVETSSQVDASDDAIQQKIEDLRESLHQHNYNYYVLNAPTLSDQEFDVQLAELAKLEKAHPEYNDPNSPTQRVGSDISNSFETVKHRYPMLSLGNTYNEGEVRAFFERAAKDLNEEFEICAELKYDGTSISLTYEQGKLVRAVTRGDGTQGDDVTNNVKTIPTIPLQLPANAVYPDVFEMRGEILMPWDTFNRLNEERERQEEALLANPRNAAAGALKLQQSSEVAKRGLDAYLYYILGEDIHEDGHYESLNRAHTWGFKVSDHMRLCKNIDEVMEYIHYWDEGRKSLPVATDGIVLKINSRRQQRALGNTAKNPRWAIAFKFQAEKACTRLNNVVYQVGRTGAITPVAELDPVQLSGTTVKRASLHNDDIIQQLDLYIGDMVYVEKGGEIIPKITGVDKDQRLLVGDKVHFIKNCPDCGTTLVRDEGEAAHYCPNSNGCPTQLRGRVEHFISRKAMNVDGLGPETVDLFFDQGLIRNCADLYTITREQILKLDKKKDKSADNIIKGIEASKDVPFERVLFGLGIRFVGETVAKRLAHAFKDMDALQAASLDDLVHVDDIGERIAESVRMYFADEQNKELIGRLREYGLQMKLSEEVLANQSEKLLGMSIVISGVFEKHSRDEYKNMIVQHGGKSVGSISKKTSFILAGANMGPSKLEKAQKLGVKILDEMQFLDLIQ